MATNKLRKPLAIGFTIFNIPFFFLLLAVAYTAPIGFGSSSYFYISMFFIIITFCTPLSVPIGVYKGWQYIDNPSIKPFLFYHFLPFISFVIVMIFCTISTYWLW